MADSKVTFEKLRPLPLAVAHYLFIESKNVPDGKAALFRAAALALINEKVDPGGTVRGKSACR